MEWEKTAGNYVLDPTFNWMAAKTEPQGSATYIPFYAYDGAHKYRAHKYHAAYAGVVAQN